MPHKREYKSKVHELAKAGYFYEFKNHLDAFPDEVNLEFVSYLFT